MQKHGLGALGICKYCSILNINLNNLPAENAEKSLDEYLMSTIEKNKEYSKIVTSIKLNGLGSSQNDLKFIKRISLNEAFLKRLPNLVSISINGIAIESIDEFIKECRNLKNIEFKNTVLGRLSPSLFDMNSNLNQIRIDNNPIVEIPASLFSIQSLRSLSLSRLSLSRLPESILEKLEGNFEFFLILFN
jgi:Leucine-rich repeat (LRR) protein